MIKRFSHKLYGLIGNPVSHSLSPNMHNAAFKKLDIDAAYLPFQVQKARLKEAISSLKKEGIAGFNVTIPFKSECMRYLDSVDPLAKMIGAVNTVLVKGGRLIGKNTDYAGFLKSLRQDLNFSPKDKPVFILGAGGGARAVAFALASKGCQAIFVCDVKAQKAKALAGEVKKGFCKIKAQSCALKEISYLIKDCRLLVNCTPLGMNDKDPLPIDTRLLHKGLMVYDIIYTPLKTRLIKAAEKRSLKATGGVGMLLYQGVIAFELWTGKKAPVALMKKELLDSLR